MSTRPMSGTKKTEVTTCGTRPQIGVTLLKAEMDGLSFKGGYEAAWDDISNAELVPKLVREARELEWTTSRNSESMNESPNLNKSTSEERSSESDGWT